MCSAIYVDFKDVRASRQKSNDLKVFHSIEKDDKTTFYKNINQNEFNRTLEDLEMSFEEFWEKCLTDTKFAKLGAINLSKCASRQGSRDELKQIETSAYRTKIRNRNYKSFRD